ncbi:MAG TPA: glucose 1-dehydrogenase [Fodinibius sp.]|nr:glucose 1-dehydrogenase [Fodinibius sp.]
MKRLENKIAVITGGAGGMGTVHAQLFIKEGAKVIIADLDNEKGEKLATELGENAQFIKLDVTDVESWKILVRETERIFGHINILVNNAGIAITKPYLDTSFEEYKNLISVNQDGIFIGMKEIYPSMKKADNGSIINISSTAGLLGVEKQTAYGTSKFAVRGMTKHAALEFAKDNIRVNSVHPGAIRTEMLDQEDTRSILEALEKTIPLQRIAEPIEVSNLVLFLASDESSYSTGAEFIVDGGLSQKL